MTTPRSKASVWFFGIFVVCAIVGLVARLVDTSSHTAHPPSDAEHAKHKD